MSILIKGMEIPINCIYDENGKTKFCFFCNHDDTPFCAYRGSGLGLDDERPDWCPLAEVPAPHGDLIDADKLMRDISKYHVSDGKFQHWVDVQSTIIEAEEGEDHDD